MTGPVAPMLATSGPLPTGDNWAFELKWDGVRAIASFSPRLRLWARSGTEITQRYPELSHLQLPRGTLLDGELVVLHNGAPSFHLLADRMHRDHPSADLIRRRPVTYLVFDLLQLGIDDLTTLPYADRRARLEALHLSDETIAVPPAFNDGPATWAASEQLGLEGVVAKKLSSPYRPGVRSPDWIKHRHEYTMDVLVGGWRPGVRRIGGLLVGTPEPEGLFFRGRVGGGISAATEHRLLELLEPLARPTSPFSAQLDAIDRRGAHWVEPLLSIEVAYGQETPTGRLRFPRLRKVIGDA